jgi:hypothetical protein
VSAEILNPQGTLITVPIWVKSRLKRLALLTWNSEKRKNQVSPRYFQLAEILTEPRFRITVSAQDPSTPKQKHKGHLGELYKFLGSDCSGSHWVDCSCEECKPTQMIKRGK